jgi:hypothetical protein
MAVMQSLMEYPIDLGGNSYAAASWGTRQTDPFGNAIRGGFNNYIGVNYEWFPFEPYAWPLNFFGRQGASIQPTEYLHGEYFGYRGILPYALQNVSPQPYPYELGYPFNLSA